MLTPKERLHNAMKGKLVDRPPCICPGGMMNMVTAELMDAAGIYMPEAHTDAEKMAGLARPYTNQDALKIMESPSV